SCSTVAATFPVSLKPWPATPDPIAGPLSVCYPSSQKYSVNPIPYATAHTWSYSGTGVSITGNGTSSVNLVFGPTPTAGQLTVTGQNDCGNGPVSAPVNIELHPRPDVTYPLCHDAITTRNAKPFTLRGGNPYGPTGTYHLNFASNPALPGDLFNPAVSPPLCIPADPFLAG
ncbi:MAG TPA: hypothetical protein PLK82_12460, partial [Bacteroidales bacterium]|nr:hypothetical protein [Bacteroidales bacterium]